MDSHGSEHRKQTPFRRFVLAPVSLIATVLYVCFFVSEVIEHFHHTATESEPKTSLLEQMQEGVNHQLSQIRSVNADFLTGSYIADLDTYDCTWYLHCRLRNDDAQAAAEAARDCPTCPQWLSRFHLATPPPQLVIPFGPFPVPTFHLIFGTPHALAVLVQNVWHAGFWAVVMFLTCTVIHFALFRLLFTKDGFNPILFVMMFLTAPLIITVLVQIIQWIATGLFNGVSWAIGELVLVVAYSSALSIVVALPHIWKAPREVIEAAEVIRNV